MPPRHLHNHPRHSPLLALTNDRRLGETRHLYWDIWRGHNLRPLKRRSTHTGSFVYLCQAESRLEISLPQQLTSASCFLFPWPPLRPSCPSLFGHPEPDPQSWLLWWCCCSGVLFRSWTKPRTVSKDRTEGDARARRGPLLLAAPQWVRERRPRRRWVSLNTSCKASQILWIKQVVCSAVHPTCYIQYRCPVFPFKAVRY